MCRPSGDEASHRFLPWPRLPHCCGNAAHEMDGFRAGFQEHYHLRCSCGPSAPLGCMRLHHATRWLFSCLERTVSILKQKARKVLWLYSLTFCRWVSTPQATGYLLVVKSTQVYCTKISNWLGLWQNSLRTCQTNSVAQAVDFTCHTSSLLYSIKLYNAVYIYIYVCMYIYIYIYMYNPFDSLAQTKRQAQKMHAGSTLQWGGCPSFWQIDNECHPRLHPLQLAAWSKL